MTVTTLDVKWEGVTQSCLCCLLQAWTEVLFSNYNKVEPEYFNIPVSQVHILFKVTAIYRILSILNTFLKQNEEPVVFYVYLFSGGITMPNKLNKHD